MKLPANLETYALKGLCLCPLTLQNKEEMMQIQADTLAALPDPAWYMPSDEWEFDEWLAQDEAFGYFDGKKLAGFAVCTPAAMRGERCYAGKLSEESAYSFDFHDVMVLPAYRGRGIHTMFLKLFDDVASKMGGRAIYATVAPENSASHHNFEKAGYVCVATKAAYDGRLRRYYKRSL